MLDKNIGIAILEACLVPVAGDGARESISVPFAFPNIDARNGASLCFGPEIHKRLDTPIDLPAAQG